MRIAGFLAGVVLAANGCEWFTAPLPPGAVRFDPPAIYERWWSLTQECSALTGNLRSIDWYVVPGATSVPGPGGEQYDGVWYPNPSRIVLAGESQFHGDLVRHEMLHALSAGGGHPRSLFIGRCGGVVACVTGCLDEAGPPPAPDPSAEQVPPTALRVAVEVTPSTPSSAEFDGHFMMIVSAHNETGKTLQVQLPPSGDAGPPASFSFLIDAQTSLRWYDMRAYAPEVTRFSVGEVKRFIFDFRNRPGPYRYDVEPGTYTFDGAYGRVWATSPPTVTVLP